MIFFSGVAVVLHRVLQQAFYISALPGVNSLNSHLCSLRNVAFSFRSVLKQQQRIVHFYDKSMKVYFGNGANPNSPLDTNTAQALKWPT